MILNYKKMLFSLFILSLGSMLFSSNIEIYRLTDLGKLEKKISSSHYEEVKGEGLPLRWIWPFEEKEKKPITSLSYHADNPKRLLVSTGEEILISEDGGESFKEVANQDKIHYSAYFTAVAMSHENPLDEWVIGTSFNGLYLTKDGGKTWHRARGNFNALFYGWGSFDTINDIIYSLSDPTKVYLAYGIYGKMALFNTDTEQVELITEIPDSSGIISLSISNEKGIEKLEARTPYSLWSLSQNQWNRIAVFKKPLIKNKELDRRKKVEERKGLYLSSWTASDLNVLRRHFEFIKAHGMNSVVIDFKDDFGRVMYDSQIPLAREIKAINPLLKVKEIREMADEYGIYIIARFVVFKDKNLYEYNNNEYALWDKVKGSPWRHVVKQDDGTFFQSEYWVDLYSPEIWDYNVSLIKELQSLGIDEIQFDYIRFPSDGPTRSISSRHNKKEMASIDALESFLKYTRLSVDIPLSMDIFGYNGWFLTNSLGQNMQRLSLYVDAISPMTYPSHFGADFLSKYNFMQRAYFLYKEGADRTEFYTQGRTIVREYVQAFLLGKERNFDESEYYQYLEEQIKGVHDSFGSGWLLWNASNNYYMVRGNLSSLKG